MKNFENCKFESQETNEKIIKLLRQHVITQIPAILAVIFLLILPLVYLLLDYSFFHFLGYLSFKTRVFLFLVWYFVALGFAFERFLFWYFNVYLLTNERIVDIDFYGITARRISQAKLSQIQDISSEMTGPFRVLFHFGDVLIQTAAERPEFEFKAVAYCDEVAKLISQEARKEEAEPPGEIA